MRRKTTEDFIKRARSVHGDKYDYSQVDYQGNKAKVKIGCPVHGYFWQLAYNHYLYGCTKCGLEKQVKDRTMPQENFIKKANQVHNNKYDYSQVHYINARTPVKIICPIHGVFEQIPDSHLRRAGCPKCSLLRGTQKALKTKKERNITNEFSLNEFLSIVQDTFNNKYDYSLIDRNKWHGLKTRVKIICPVHGVFEQLARHHRHGRGCPKCCQSKGEVEITKYLDSTKVFYTTEYKIKDCKYKAPLPFDFAIFNEDGSLKCLIEYQGKQHFEPVYWLPNCESTFKSQQIRDKIKRDYCEKNGIQLLLVSYEQDLNEFFEEAGGLLWK